MGDESTLFITLLWNTTHIYKVYNTSGKFQSFSVPLCSPAMPMNISLNIDKSHWSRWDQMSVGGSSFHFFLHSLPSLLVCCNHLYHLMLSIFCKFISFSNLYGFAWIRIFLICLRVFHVQWGPVASDNKRQKFACSETASWGQTLNGKK